MYVKTIFNKAVDYFYNLLQYLIVLMFLLGLYLVYL